MSAAAYQSGEKLFSEYDGQWKSGDHQERIVFKDILLPPNAPKAYADRQTLWNAVDTSESKDNAQTARRFIITLPKELPIEENIRLIRDYCELFSKGCNSPHLIEHSYTGSSVADGKMAMQGTAA